MSIPIIVRIPENLLRAVDRRAHSLGVSQGSVVVRALARETDNQRGWSRGFFEALAVARAGDRAALSKVLGQPRSRANKKAGDKNSTRARGRVRR